MISTFVVIKKRVYIFINTCYGLFIPAIQHRFPVLFTVLRVPTTIGIAITFMLYNFFSLLERSRYWQVFSLSLIFTLLFPRMTKSNGCQGFMSKTFIVRKKNTKISILKKLRHLTSMIIVLLRNMSCIVEMCRRIAESI